MYKQRRARRRFLCKLYSDIIRLQLRRMIIIYKHY